MRFARVRPNARRSFDRTYEELKRPPDVRADGRNLGGFDRTYEELKLERMIL